MILSRIGFFLIVISILTYSFLILSKAIFAIIFREYEGLLKCISQNSENIKDLHIQSELASKNVDKLVDLIPIIVNKLRNKGGTNDKKRTINH